MTEITAFPSDDSQPLRGDAVIIDLDWAFGRDLDLGLLYRNNEGDVGLVYSGDTGKRTMPPYVHLRHQSHGEGRSKTRREHGVVTRLSANAALYVLVWDVRAANDGVSAPFADDADSYSVTVRDRSNRHITLKGMRSSDANCLLIGCIAGAALYPMSSATTLSGANRSAVELLDLIEDTE